MIIVGYHVEKNKFIKSGVINRTESNTKGCAQMIDGFFNDQGGGPLKVNKYRKRIAKGFEPGESVVTGCDEEKAMPPHGYALRPENKGEKTRASNGGSTTSPVCSSRRLHKPHVRLA